MEFSVCAVGNAVFVRDDVMIAPFEKVVFSFVNKGVAVFFVDFKEGLDEVFCVGVNSGVLVVDRIGEDEDVHGISVLKIVGICKWLCYNCLTNLCHMHSGKEAFL